VVLAETELVIVPFEFDDAAPPAFQHQATWVLPLPLIIPLVPRVNPSLLNAVIICVLPVSSELVAS